MGRDLILGRLSEGLCGSKLVVNLNKLKNIQQISTI